MPKKSNSREIILDAAEGVLAEMGATHLSLDVVAKHAGVSKGGLMYHFSTKQSLLKALMERMIHQYYKDRERAAADLPFSKGRLFKAALIACLEPNERRDRIGISVLAALTHDRELLEPLKKAYATHNDDLKESGLPFAPCAITSLASDGLMFWELLGISPFNSHQRELIQKELLAMIDEMEQRQ